MICLWYSITTFPFPQKWEFSLLTPPCLSGVCFSPADLYCISQYKQSFCLANRPHIPLIAVALGELTGNPCVRKYAGEHTPGIRSQAVSGQARFPPQGPVCSHHTPVENSSGIPDHLSVFLIKHRAYNYRSWCQAAALSLSMPLVCQCVIWALDGTS